MASELFAARSDFANFGSSLASLQQNATADQISNNAALQNYNNVSAQLKAAVPSGFGDIAFGAFELLGQGKDLVARLSKVREAVSAAPDAIKAALVKGGNQLGARVNQAKSLVSDTTNALQTTGDSLRASATAGADELQTLATTTVSDLRSAVPALEGGAIELSPGVFMTRTGRIAPPAPGTVAEVAPTEIPFSLPLATKRPTASTFADTLQPENVLQSGLRELDPEMSAVANLGSFRGPSLTGVDVPGVSSQAGDFLRGLAPESMITRPGEEILPSGLQSLQSQGGAALSDALGASERVGGAAQEVVTNLASTAASTAARGGAVASDLASAGTGAVTKAAATLQEAGGAATDLVKGAVSDVAETALEASSAFLPIVGEVTAVALGGYQIYEGFKDLFSHPSAAAPVTVAMPTVANIGQGFQSGI